MRPNEVAIARELLEALFAQGSSSPGFQVTRGPAPEARIVGVRLEADVVVLVYDQPVAEPVFLRTGTPPPNPPITPAPHLENRY